MTEDSAHVGRPRVVPVNRLVLVGLGTIAAAAAVLTFTSVQQLAVMCGYGPHVAWLLPVVMDVTAAVATGVWLGRGADREARRFARVLAWAALVLSIVANGLQHGLAAYGTVLAVWWVAVLVSAVPPLMLGGVVHLAVLAGRQTVETEAQIGTADRTDEGAGPVGGADRPDRIEDRAEDRAEDRTDESESATVPVERGPLLRPVRDSDAAPGPSPADGPDRTGPPVATGPPAPRSRRTGPNQRRRDDEPLLAQLRCEPVPLGRNEVMRRTGVGAGRADRLMELLGWSDTTVAAVAQ